MAVEFGRVEKIQNAFLTHDEENNPKLVHEPQSIEANKDNLSGDHFQVSEAYRCKHRECNYIHIDKTNWRGLLSHMASHTRARNEQLKLAGHATDFSCPYCKRNFKTLEKLLRHIEGGRCRESDNCKTNKQKYEDVLQENW